MPLSLKPLAAAGIALALAPRAPVLAQTLDSAHWTSTVTVEGAPAGAVFQRAEVWFKEGRLRVEVVGPKGRSITLDTGGDLYAWTDGEKTGLRINPAMSASSGQPSHAYVRRVEEIRQGTPVRTETVDGHSCDVFEYAGLDGKGTYWLAKDLRFFPVKIVLQRPLAISLPFAGSRQRKTPDLYVHNTEIAVPAAAAPVLFAVPSDVHFRDAAEVMRPLRR